MAYDLLFGPSYRNFGLRSVLGEDPFIWTSDSSRAEFNRIRIVLDTINREMSQAVKDGIVSAPEWESWYDLYKSAHKLTTISTFFTVWKGDIAMARQQEQEALKWHSLVLSRKGKNLDPAGMTQKKDEPSPLDLGWNLPTIALTAGGIFTVGYLIKSIRGK